MSKKDYWLIANVLNANRPDPSVQGQSAERYLGMMQMKQAIAQSMSAALALADSKFEPKIFLDACGYDL